MKSKGLKPRMLYPARLPFKIKGEIDRFSDKKKNKNENKKQLKEFITTKPALQEILKGLL